MSNCILKHFDPKDQTVLTCDASNYGVGVILFQIDHNNIKILVAFASRTLNKAELNYSQLDKEALAIVFGVNKFYCYL